MTTSLVSASGTFEIGGETTVNRLGFGAMRLTGTGVWGDPADPEEAIRVLRRAVELGVTFIDTADSYGPFVSEQLIKQALHPYPDELVIATKAGLTRHGPGIWKPLGRPEYLRQQCHLSLRHLGLERIELYQLHRIDPKVPLAEQLGALVELQQEGKIHHIGLSEVTVSELQEAQQTAHDRHRAEPLQPLQPLRPRRCWIIARSTASASSRGSRWRPASLPAPAVRSIGPPRSSTRPPRSSRSPGCSGARR